MKWTYQIANVWGIPIKLHVTLLLYLFLPYNKLLHPLLLLILMVGGMVSITLHELGHCYVALREGCRVRDIVLLPIGAVARLESMPERPRGELLMALAGPLVSLGISIAIAVPTIAFFRYQGSDTTSFHESMRVGLLWLAGANFSWAVFNLLPAFPMDGGRVLRAALTTRLGKLRATGIASTIGRGIALIMGLTAIFVLRDLRLGLIAVFIYHLAGREYRTMLMQENARRFGFWFRPQQESQPEYQSPGEARQVNNIEVGPAPYDQE